MNSGFIVRLRPVGPWRLGPSSGARDRVDRVLHSDTLYSALTIAARELGMLADWLAATAESKEPAVRVGSGFPFVGRTLLAPAPKHVWPPTSAGKLRWKAARFVPLQVAPRLLAYESLKEDRWAIDPISESVLPVEKFGEVTPPFRVSFRRTAVVDRVSGISHEASETACLEFTEGSGFWCPVWCSEDWTDRVQGLFRFIADAGVGGERSLGWGRSAMPEFEALPAALVANAGENEHHETGYWVLSLFAPAESDRVDWSRGSYSLLRRSGRTDARGELKAESAMVEEGSIVIADSVPVGFARNIAPEGSDHAIYRAGFAVVVPVSVRLPSFQTIQKAQAVEPAVEPSPALPPVTELAAEDEAVEDIAAAPPISDESAAPQGSEAEQVKDVLTELPKEAESEFFVVETSPVPEQFPVDIADGEAVEDSPGQPSIADEDGSQQPEVPTTEEPTPEDPEKQQ
jgi:CRISPR-associated protein Csm4